MADADSIEGAGTPLAFRAREGHHRAAVLGGDAGLDRFRVEARAFHVGAAGGGHQKEAIVTEGDGGVAWRMVSDEGPGLGGTDLAPFPLGFFNAAQQADLAGGLHRAARAARIRLDEVRTACDNLYWSEGSFFQGTGGGYAAAPVLRLAVRTNAAGGQVAALARQAIAASPMLALCRSPLVNTFGLYVNGKRVPVTGMPASDAPDVPDPLKIYRGAPRPVGVAPDAPLIEKLVVADAQPARRPVPGDGRVDIEVNGIGELDAHSGLARSEVWLPLSPTSRFALVSDMRDDASLAARVAPAAVSYGLAGLAFCYLTQLLRYTSYRKYKVRAVRVVQLNDVGISRGADGAPAAVVGPADTHLYLHGDEPDAVMQSLLALGATRCYLHSTLGPALEPRVELAVNGVPVAL